MAFFSTKSSDYSDAINKLVKPTYESKYDNKIEDTLNKILNKESFSYDFNADPLYQNYKDQYTKLGKEASINAAANVASLTGGYGNSYGATAASQANQQYLTQLNNVIPDLYNAAMDKYQMEVEDMYNQFGALQSEEGRLYGQHRDDVSDYYSDWSNLQTGFSTAQAHEEWQEQMEYQKARDAIADSQWERTFNNSNNQWSAQMEYQKARDAVADDQWLKEYQMALDKVKSSGSGSGRSGSGRSYSNSNSNSSVTNSKGMTMTDANKHLKAMAAMSDSDAASYAKKLQQDGIISKEDANYLYDQYLKQTGGYSNKGYTTLDIIRNIQNI